MVDVNAPPAEEILTGFSVDFSTLGNSMPELRDFTVQKIMLGESLLTPGLQTSIEVDSYRHNYPVKNFDLLKQSVVEFKAERKILQKYGIKSTFSFNNQVVYRIENRHLRDGNNERFTIRACDPTLLNNFKNLVSKSWKCSTPSDVVSYVLSSCAGARNINVEGSSPARPYVAENIHPFQVVTQQAQVALAGGNDPSFVHFMTYENNGTHHFRSLYNMTKQSPIMTYIDGSGTQSYGNPFVMMNFQFPCDFDLLSDIMNGIGPDGEELGSVVVFNPVNKMFSLVGNQTLGCGVGQGVVKMAQTNKNTEKNQDSCPISPEKYMKKRQARMSLLERDKIALRMTVPWNPMLNVGKVIRLDLQNKDALSFHKTKAKNYGSGDYLILHMYHTIQRGGYGTTTLDCVSTTVGQGIV